GAGAESSNTILTSVDAYAAHTTLLQASGNVELSADNTSAIGATVVAASLAVGAGAAAGVGVSVGAATADNTIGEFNSNYTTNATPASVARGSLVKDATTGEIYEYVGAKPLTNPDLSSQDFSNREEWIQLGEVQAFLYDTNVKATGALDLSATGD